MRKKFLYNTALVIIILSLIIGVFITQYKTPKPSGGGNSGGISAPPIVYEPATEEDYIRLEEILPQNEIIQKLPESARILLRFYNFDTGEREWEKSYVLTRANAIETYDEDVDIILIMHSKYLSKLNENNFCFIIKDAKRKGDFANELKISKTKALWRYKSVMSYKDCLGL